MANDAANVPESEREVVITRTINAPPRIVFLAHSRPEHVKQWFGPKGWPLTRCEMDFRVGGKWRFAMTGPTGEEGTPFGGTYLEIVPDARIVYDNAFEIDGSETMVTTLTFVPEGDNTRVTMRTVFGSRAMYATHVGAGFKIGVNSGLDLLEELVSKLAR